MYSSELWRNETSMTQTLSANKEELAKSDQALRSMAGRVSFKSVISEVPEILSKFQKPSKLPKFQICPNNQIPSVFTANPEWS